MLGSKVLAETAVYIVSLISHPFESRCLVMQRFLLLQNEKFLSAYHRFFFFFLTPRDVQSAQWAMSVCFMTRIWSCSVSLQ
jgi:hypothetical protein